MVSQKVKITNPTGLHLRPAGIFSNIANKFECRITFEYENSIANAKECTKYPWCRNQIRR